MDDTLRQILAELVRAHAELDQLRSERERLLEVIKRRPESAAVPPDESDPNDEKE